MTGGAITRPQIRHVHTARRHARRPAPRPIRRPSCWWPAAFGALAGLVLFWVARPALMDDAYISLSYARNLAEHGQWALVEGLPANTATSPLNVLLLAGLTALSGSTVTACGLLLAACLAASAVGVHRLAGPSAAVAAVLLLAGAPALNSAVGLEVYLLAALLIGTVCCASRGPWWAAGVLAGLLALARPDAAVMAVTALAVCVPRRAPAALGVAAAVGAPWVAWSWAYFGDLVPRTMAVKTILGADRDTLLDGWGYYLQHFPAASAVTALTILVGLVAFGAAVSDRQWPAAALGAAGLAHLITLAALNTAAVFYYLAPAVTALGVGAVLVAARQHGWWPVVGLLIAAGLLLVGSRGLPWADGRAPIRANYATPAEYAAIAADLPAGVVRSTSTPEMRGLGEIGTLAFFAPPGTRVVEFLSDPGRTADYVRRWEAEHPRLGWLYADVTVGPLPSTHRIVVDPDAGAGPYPATAAERERSVRIEPAG